MTIKTFLCQICEEDALNRVLQFEEFSRVTSDCRPFEKGGELAICAACGGVQKLPSPTWHEEISRIYSKYEAYFQADGEEQVVFDAVRGTPRARSEVFLDRLRSGGFLGQVESVLDVGCGTGVTLRALHNALPRAALNGYELTDQNLGRLERIPRFTHLFTGEIGGIDRRFDFISMVHSLEHFPNPFAALESIGKNLNPGGILFVEVCDVESNPFDLLIADHLMHFTKETLSRLVGRAGYEVLHVTTNWIGKEISLVARFTGVPSTGSSNKRRGAKGAGRISQSLHWLKEFSKCAANNKSCKPFGIFGTSISATWVASEIALELDYFVDEDKRRIGRLYLGKPILSIRDVPEDGTTFLALVPAVADLVCSRFSSLPLKFIRPPPYEL